MVDSLEGLELAMAAERTFDISISDDELSSAIRSVPSLIRLVHSKMAQSNEMKRRAR
ncbi:MAG: phosphopantetheine-binding protein [Thermomicrobiales bacterium]